MSYDIYIGDGQRCEDDEDHRCDWYVPHMTLPDAPCFDGDGMTGQGNSRHPSYTVWSNFTRTVGLYELFFDAQTGLMRDHPGYQPLTTEHYQTVKTARIAYERRVPGHLPGWADGQDPMLARLLWLEWWMFKTLQTAEIPMIYNY